MIIRPRRTRLFVEGESLVRFLISQLPRLRERSVLVVTSKIVALSERRTAVVHNDVEREKLIRAESSLAIRTRYTWLTVKDGMIMASAGIDASNANGKLVLLPKDSFAAARRIRTALRRHYRLQHLGVVITDSKTIPFRAGVCGIALGYAGFRGIKDYRGTPDLFGRLLKMSRVDIADSIAAAAVLTMGEGKERRPVAIINGAPVEFCNRVRRSELAIDLWDDMYRPLLQLPPRHVKKKAARKS